MSFDFSTLTAELDQRGIAYWQSGECLLVNGDQAKVLPFLGDGACGMAMTSPPYNLKKQWWDSGANGCMPEVAKKFTEDWYPDEVPEDQYQADQKRMITECLRVAGCMAYNHKVRYAHKRCGRAFHPMEWLAGFPLWVEIVWDRGGGIAFNSRRPIVSDERIYILGRPGAWTNCGYKSVWRIPPDNGPDSHPCAYPVELPRRCIESFSARGDVILDPMCGSGTTGVACVATGRGFLGVEIHGPYYEIAKQRIAAAQHKTLPIRPEDAPLWQMANQDRQS